MSPCVVMCLSWLSSCSLALRVHSYPVTHCTILALLLGDVCRPVMTQFAAEVQLHLHLGKEQKLCLTSLPHSRLLNLSQLVNYLSFLAVIVSIDTTLHLTPTGLHNLVFLPGTHKSTHIQRHWHTHTHARTHPHSAPSHSLSDFASGELESCAYLWASCSPGFSCLEKSGVQNQVFVHQTKSELVLRFYHPLIRLALLFFLVCGANLLLTCMSY